MVCIQRTYFYTRETANSTSELGKLSQWILRIQYSLNSASSPIRASLKLHLLHCSSASFSSWIVYGPVNTFFWFRWSSWKEWTRFGPMTVFSCMITSSYQWIAPNLLPMLPPDWPPRPPAKKLLSQHWANLMKLWPGTNSNPWQKAKACIPVWQMPVQSMNQQICQPLSSSVEWIPLWPALKQTLNEWSTQQSESFLAVIHLSLSQSNLFSVKFLVSVLILVHVSSLLFIIFGSCGFSYFKLILSPSYFGVYGVSST